MKKFQMKRAGSIILAAAMFASIAAACDGSGGNPQSGSAADSSSKQESSMEEASANISLDMESTADDTVTVSDGYKLTDEPLTLTYWVDLDSNAASKLNSFSENAVYQEMEKITGVKIEFEHPAVGQAREQFNLLIASQDFPDFIEYSWAQYAGGAQKAIDDNVIISLDELLKTEAPDALAMMTSNPTVEKQCKTDQGSFYAFTPVAQIDPDNVDFVQSGLMIRADWLEELGLEVPGNMEEWEAVLRKIKEEKEDVIPFIHSASGLIESGLPLVGAFGIGSDYYQDNGTVKYGPVQPEYKEYLKMLNRWYTDGLLDPDFASNDKAAVDSKMSNGGAASTFGLAGSGFGTYMTANADNPDYELVGVQYPVQNSGAEPQFMPRAWDVRVSGMLAITSANKNPEISAKWANYFYTREGGLLKNFGIEGDTYNLVEGNVEVTDKLLHNPEGLSYQQALGVYTRGSTPSPGAVIKIPPTLPQQKAAMETWNTYNNNSLEVLIPPVSFSPEESERIAVMETNIKSYLEEKFVLFVMGQESLDKFDEFVEQLNGYGIEEMVSIYQAALERYNNR